MTDHKQLFQKNLHFLEGINSELAAKILQVSGAVEIQANPSGTLSLSVLGQCWADSLSDVAQAQWESQYSKPDRVMMARVVNDQAPYDIAEMLPDIFDSEDLISLSKLPNLRMDSDASGTDLCLSRDILLIGALSLFYVPSLLALESPLSIVLVESDLEQFAAALHLVDFGVLIEQLRSCQVGFHFIYETTWASLQARVLGHIGSVNPLAVHGIRVYRSLYLSPDLLRLHAWLHAPDGLVEHFKGFLGSDTDELNQVLHAAWNTLAYPRAHCLRADLLLNDHPIVLVASGPSLDEQISWLKDHHHQMTIVSAGSALGALLRAGIHVDAAVLLEMGSVVFRDLSDLLVEGHDLSGIVLFASITIDPRIAAEFSKVVFFHRPLSSAFTLFPDEAPAVLPQAGPQAANAAIEVALQLGSRHLLLLGCDFAAADPCHPRAKQAIGSSDRRFDLPVPGRLGKTVFSSAELSVTRQLFENALSLYGAAATSLGNGAFLQGVCSLPGLPDLEDLTQFYQDPAEFHRAIEALPPRTPSAASLSATFAAARADLRTATVEIRSLLEASRQWTHALSKDLGHFVTWEDQHLSPPARLRHRLTRFLYFFVPQPLHDRPADDPAWHQQVEQAVASLRLIEQLFTAFFMAMEAICSAPRLPAFDQRWIKARLTQAARAVQVADNS